MAPTSLGRNKPDADAQARRPNADAVRVVRALGPLLVAFLVLVNAAAAAADPTPRLIVKRERGATAADIRAGAGVRLVRRLGVARTELVRAERPRAALAALNADPDVVYAVPNLRGHAAEDPLFDQQWDVAAIRAPDAWPVSQGASSVVAVVDGWVDTQHADLAGNVVPGADYLPSAEPETAGDKHGTHVAGIVAAVRGNGEGGTGVAPAARVMPLRVLGQDGSGSLADVLEALDDAPGAGARVVSASLTFGPITSDAEAHGLNAAFKDVAAAHRDTVYVVPAGNAPANRPAFDNDAVPSFPCNATAANIVCVGASDEADAAAAISNYGASSVDLFAPGTAILSTFPGDDYGTMSGTSMATPHVSAVAALVRSLRPTLSGAHVRNLLMRSAQPVAALAGKAVEGARVDALGALEAVEDSTDSDGDGRSNAIDNCRTAANFTQRDLDYDGPGDVCDSDRDGDGRANTADRCPDVFASGADGCEPPPPPPDRDGDGVPDAVDACPDVAAVGGCPPPPPDGDGDGRIDAQDACPAEAASTSTGCPVPALETFTATVDGRRARVRVEADRAAEVLFKIERRRCRDDGCRWKRVVRETAVAPTGGVTLRLSGLRIGRYRATVRLSSPAGESPFARERFRIRR